jgi:hypothetical protein
MKRLAICLVAILLGTAEAHAAGEPLWNKPVYNESTKSYFELVKVTSAESKSASPFLLWSDAMTTANRRAFKGTQGRLAVIPSMDVHLFLRETFRPNTWTWTGLRYFCKLRQLQWSDGTVMPAKGFQAWHAKWDQSGGGGCVNGGGEAPWMPVVYSPVGEGFQWIAKGARKGYGAYFVEYPTGKP